MALSNHILRKNIYLYIEGSVYLPDIIDKMGCYTYFAIPALSIFSFKT